MYKFIFKLNCFINRIINKINSKSIAAILKNNPKLYVEYPCSIVNAKYIEIQDNFTARKGLRLECIDSYENHPYHPKLIVNKNVSCNFSVHIGCIDRVEIGENCLIGSNVLITDHSHGKVDQLNLPPSKRLLYSKGPVVIGPNVWIGENVCILPNVEIGEGCIIGAGAVVTKSMPSYSVAVGNPAKVVKKLRIN